ncbi:MAG: autoinducer 2 ABC transporter substrate-binding protein [Bacillota bacterium]
MLKKKTTIILLGVLISLVFILSFSAAAEEYEIATIVKITGIPWFNRMEVGVDQAAEELDVNSYQIGPSEADPAQQVKMVEDLIAKDVDAITVVPNDATVLEPVFRKARENGIIVITHESPNQKGADWDVETIDNQVFGEENFKKLAELMDGEGQFAIFVGSLTVPLHNNWADVGLEYVKENYPDMELVTERIPCGESVEESYTRTIELLKTYPDLKGIVGFGSLGPIGAAQALEERNKTDQVAVVGTVIPGHAARYLKNGGMDYGYLWDPKDAGFAQVYIAKYILDGNEIEDGMEIPGLGKAEVDAENKVIKVDAMIDITAENAASYGF